MLFRATHAVQLVVPDRDLMQDIDAAALVDHDGSFDFLTNRTDGERQRLYQARPVETDPISCCHECADILKRALPPAQGEYGDERDT